MLALVLSSLVSVCAFPEGKKMKGILGFVISELSLKFSQNKWFVCGVMSGGFMLQFYLFPQKLDVGQSFELRSGISTRGAVGFVTSLGIFMHPCL